MHIIIMGPTASGKTTVGRLLATRLGRPFYDADDFHSSSNVAKMRAGIPLDDSDRWPWLDVLHELLRQKSASGEAVVLACSALKHSYRERLTRGLSDVAFVYLKAPGELLRRRLDDRVGHYMSAALLESQLHDLEEPTHALVIDASLPPDRLVEQIAKSS